MNSPGGQQSGAGSSNGGPGDQGNQGNPTQSTTSIATTSLGFATSTSSSFTSTTPTTPTSQPTQTPASPPSPGTNKVAIIAGVVGGIGCLLALSLLLIWLLNRRKKRQIAVKNGTVQPVTYTGLNSAFSGVPFAHRSNRNPHDSLTPAPLLLSSSTHSSDIEMRGGHASPGSAAESDMFLPTYVESQAAASLRERSSLGRLDTSHGSPSSNVSPMSSTNTDTIHNLSPALSDLPPVPPLNVHRRERDTMGFPIEPGMASPSLASPGLPAFETIHIPPEISLPIVSPTPRHPLVHQDSLERQVRLGMTDSPEPPPSINPARLRVLSQEMPRESPILGLNSVRIHPSSNLNPSAEINRMASQRTVSSIGSMPPVVSDAELEDLGIGAGRAP